MAVVAVSMTDARSNRHRLSTGTVEARCSSSNNCDTHAHVRVHHQPTLFLRSMACTIKQNSSNVTYGR